MLIFQELGITQKQYNKIIDEANSNGNGSITQDELGSYLAQAVENGSLTDPQAEAIWRSMNWDKSFSEAMRAVKNKAAAMETLEKAGFSEKDYDRFLSEADTDRDDSVSQAEMYAYLKDSELPRDAKSAVWAAQGWTKSMDDVAREALTAEMKAAAFAGDSAAFNAALSEYTRTKRAKDAYSAVKSFVRKVYMGADLSDSEYSIVGGSTLTEEQARRMLHNYAGLSVNDAVDTVSKWKAERDFVQKHGDEYEQYGLSVAQAQFYYSEVKGKVRLETFSAQVDNYGIDRVKAFYGTNGWEQTGLSIDLYDRYATAAAKCKGTDNDRDGKTDAYSVMYQKFTVIDALPVSNAIKDAICRKEGWADRNIAKAPWRNR